MGKTFDWTTDLDTVRSVIAYGWDLSYLTTAHDIMALLREPKDFAHVYEAYCADGNAAAAEDQRASGILEGGW
jgi:hypothetical protein